jgi:hypothetical protein
MPLRHGFTPIGEIHQEFQVLYGKYLASAKLPRMGIPGAVSINHI